RALRAPLPLIWLPTCALRSDPPRQFLLFVGTQGSYADLVPGPSPRSLLSSRFDVEAGCRLHTPLRGRGAKAERIQDTSRDAGLIDSGLLAQQALWRGAMAVVFTCPECGRQVEVASSLAGQRALCPNCQVVVRVPGKAGKPSRTLVILAALLALAL